MNKWSKSCRRLWRRSFCNGTAPAACPRALSGFTFIEVLVVLIILALIAGIVGTQLLGEAEKARIDATRVQIKSLQTSLDLYRLHNASYPSTEQGLDALMFQPTVGILPRNWQGPYLNGNAVPTDSWSGPFVYSSDGQDYTIFSYGSDGLEGGTENAADISSEDI